MTPVGFFVRAMVRLRDDVDVGVLVALQATEVPTQGSLREISFAPSFEGLQPPCVRCEHDAFGHKHTLQFQPAYQGR